MKLSSIILISSAAILSIGIFTAMNNSSVDTTVPFEVKQAFASWKLEHGRLYSSPSEQNYRLQVFHQNFKEVQSVNSQNLSYKFALNKFSDMTQEEKETKFLGYRRMTHPTRPKTTKFKNLNQDPPASFNWQDKGAVTPVKDQKACGSCWAFSAVAAIEGTQFLHSGTLNRYSEQYLVDCDRARNAGCRGGEMWYAFDYVVANGIPLESDYEYTARDGTCRTVASDFATMDSWTMLDGKDSIELKVATMNYPMAIGICATHWFQYDSGVYSNQSCGTRLNHGVLLVGWGTSSDGDDYWLIKNSWGTSWGEDGYIRTLREDDKTVNVCGVLLESEYIVKNKD
jgi:C1A family cysteine protease